jgi:hypothetical protein
MNGVQINRKIPLLIFLVLALSSDWLSSYLRSDGTRRSQAGLHEPVQTQAQGSTTREIDGYSVDITYKYNYTIDALVVSTRNYDSGSLADKLAPVDLGLAWGKVAAYNGSIDFHWDQHDRWIYWHVDDVSQLDPIGTVATVNTQYSNNHSIPATNSVKSQLEKIKRGDRVKLEGYLVDVYAQRPDGAWFEWNTSDTRFDTGDGACEVFYITNIEIIQQS